MPRAEVDAIYDYLATIPHVRREKPENDLPFLLNQRIALLGWKWMFFKPGEYEANPDKSPEWNRGAYLVEGPGHCAGCHTPKNVSGQPMAWDLKFQGMSASISDTGQP